MIVNRGDVFYVERFQSVGSEQQSGRPAVIVSSDLTNKHSSVVEVVYLTAQPKRDMMTHVQIEATGKISTALCEQVHSVSCQRLGGYCGKCTNEELQKIDAALLISLGLHKNRVFRNDSSINPSNELIAIRAQLNLMWQLYDDLLKRKMNTT